jgi:hypothetical protein
VLGYEAEDEVGIGDNDDRVMAQWICIIESPSSQCPHAIYQGIRLARNGRGEKCTSMADGRVASGRDDFRHRDCPTAVLCKVVSSKE